MNKVNVGLENMKIMYYIKVVCVMKNNYINIFIVFKEMYFKEKVYIKEKLIIRWVKIELNNKV